MCDCSHCKISKRAQRTMKNGSHRQKAKLIQELMELLICAEFDLNYYSAIFDGYYPGGLEILERRVKQLKEKEAQNAAVADGKDNGESVGSEQGQPSASELPDLPAE